jgi:hydrogenase maturation factor
MCFTKPLKVKSIKGKVAVLENGVKVYYEKKIGVLKPNDYVLVYGNLVLNKISKKQYEQTQ